MNGVVEMLDLKKIPKRGVFDRCIQYLLFGTIANNRTWLAEITK